MVSLASVNVAVAAEPSASDGRSIPSGMIEASDGTTLTLSWKTVDLDPAVELAQQKTSPTPFGSPYEGTGRISDARGVTPSSLRTPPSSNGVKPASIIGADNRARVNPTTSFPNRAVVRITATNPAGANFSCSGFLFTRSAVATAAHCLYDRGLGGWNKNFRIYPGANGSSNPYGSCGFQTVSMPQGFPANGGNAYDYGVLRLSCTVGDTTGWFGFSYPGPASLIASGYPCDKPAATQWRGGGSKLGQDGTSTSYNADTAGCQSGGPVWAASMAIAIHAVGGSSSNSGPSLTSSRQASLQTWGS